VARCDLAGLGRLQERDLSLDRAGHDEGTELLSVQGQEDDLGLQEGH